MRYRRFACGFWIGFSQANLQSGIEGGEQMNDDKVDGKAIVAAAARRVIHPCSETCVPCRASVARAKREFNFMVGLIEK